MKRISLFIYLSFSIYFFLYGQSSYEVILESYPGGQIQVVLSSNNVDFIFPVTNITSTDFIRPYDVFFAEVDQLGNISEIILPFDIDTNHVFHMRPWKDGYLFDVEFTWPSNGASPADNSPYQRCIIELDNNFSIVDSLCFMSFGRHYGKAVLDEEHQYIFAVNESVTTRNLLYGYYSDDHKLIGRLENQGHFNFPTSLARASNGTDFLLYGFSGVFQVNQSFNLIEDLRFRFLNNSVHGYMINLSDGNIAMTGIKKLFYESAGVTYFHNLITLHVLNSEYEVMWSDTLGVIPVDLSDESGFNNPAVDGALDTLHGNLFFAGINRIVGNFLYTDIPNSIFIAKYDQSSGEVIWKYDQLNPDYYTVIYGVKATQDGGCLLYGFRTDPSTSIRYPYLLKLDEDGLLSTSTKPEEDASIRFTIYGNPSDQLRFHVNGTEGWQGKYQLLNTNGQVVMQDVVQNGLYTGNTSGLPGGVYIVVLLDKTGQLITQQKWVKQ